jgi:hypothetical protein
MSEIGSIVLVKFLDSFFNRKDYQLDLVIPGTSPRLANSLKQIRQSANLRIYPLFLPQRQQRRTTRDLNFGFLSDLEI